MGSVFCVVAAATVAVQCLLRTTVASLGSEVSARPGVSGQPPASPPPPDPPQEEQPPPADPAPAAAAHIACCLHPTHPARARLLSSCGRPRAGGPRPSWLELSIEPAKAPPPSRLLTHRRRSSVRDTTAQHTGCSDNRRWQRGGSSDL